MKIKKYTGISLESILTKVKNDLGENAVILSTKKLENEKLFGLPKIVVTAAIAPPVIEEKINNQKISDKEAIIKIIETIKQKARKNKSEPSVQSATHLEKENNIEEIKEEIREIKSLLKKYTIKDSLLKEKEYGTIYEYLKKCNVEEEIILDILESIKQNKSLSNIRNILKNELEKRFNTKSIDLNTTAKAFVFLGATGVGKTTTLAKLASISIFKNKRKTAIATFDTFRIGAHEQLEKYARLLGAPLKVISKHENSLEIISNMLKEYTLFIDTSGISQYNQFKIREMKHIIPSNEKINNILLISANSHPGEMKRIIENFGQSLEIKNLIITKCDETEKPGHLLSLYKYTRIPISFITVGQNVPEDIKEAKKLILINKVLYGTL